MPRLGFSFHLQIHIFFSGSFVSWTARFFRSSLAFSTLSRFQIQFFFVKNSVFKWYFKEYKWKIKNNDHRDDMNIEHQRNSFVFFFRFLFLLRFWWSCRSFVGGFESFSMAIVNIVCKRRLSSVWPKKDKIENIYEHTIVSTAYVFAKAKANTQKSLVFCIIFYRSVLSLKLVFIRYRCVHKQNT